MLHLFFDTISTCDNLFAIAYGSVEIFQVKSLGNSLPNLTRQTSAQTYKVSHLVAIVQQN